MPKSGGTTGFASATDVDALPRDEANSSLFSGSGPIEIQKGPRARTTRDPFEPRLTSWSARELWSHAYEHVRRACARLGMLLGMFVLARLVMMGGLKVMVRRGVVVRGGVVMMFGRGMLVPEAMVLS